MVDSTRTDVRLLAFYRRSRTSRRPCEAGASQRVDPASKATRRSHGPIREWRKVLRTGAAAPPVILERGVDVELDNRGRGDLQVFDGSLGTCPNRLDRMAGGQGWRFDRCSRGSPSTGEAGTGARHESASVPLTAPVRSN
jgi:hypothetical protein